MSCCCVFLETLRILNTKSLTHAKKEWVTKLVDSMFLEKCSGNDKYMQHHVSFVHGNMGFKLLAS